MASLRQTALKLITAINFKGDRVELEEKRFYSIKYNRLMTKYIVRRKLPGQPRETLVETYKLPELVMTLAGLYSSVCEVENGS